MTANGEAGKALGGLFRMEWSDTGPLSVEADAVTAALLGTSPEELAGNPARFLEGVQPRDQVAVREEFTRAARNKECRAFFFTLGGRDEEDETAGKRLRAVIAPDCPKNGDMLFGMLLREGDPMEKEPPGSSSCCVRDDLLHSMFDLVPGIVLGKDLQGRYAFANAGLAELLGHPLDELMGRMAKDFFPPEEAREDGITDAITKSRPGVAMMESWLQYPDGRRRLMEVRKSARRTSTGRLLGTVAYMHDITERAAFLNSPDPLFRCDREGRIWFANTGFMGLLDPDTACLGRSLTELGFGEDWVEAVREAFGSGEAIIAHLDHAVAGELRMFNCRFSVEISADGDDRVLMGLARDVTELRRAEMEAQQALQAKGDFLAAMSHEIRTPLNGIIALSKLVSQTDLEPKQAAMINTINTSGETLLRIINDILDFSKLEAGKFELSPHPYDPRRLAESVSDLMRPRAEEKGLQFVCTVDDDVPPALLGDESRLRQVLFNLAGNALKFTAEGAITLHIGRTPDGLLSMAVTDTGIGIDEEGKKRLFKEFSQVDASIARKYGGTGLGLSICRQIVTLMEGHIDVDSTPGKGSTFYFHVPCVESDEPVETKPTDIYRLPPLRILSADDSDVNQQVVEAFLEPDQHQVVLAANGCEAVDLFTGGEFDLVLMDMQMPEMDGIQATREIRTWERENGKKPTPILALTANVLPAHQKMCLDAGMDGFLQKPLDEAVLMDAMAKATGVEPIGLRHPPVETDLAEGDETAQRLRIDGVINDQFLKLRANWKPDRFRQVIAEFIRETLPLADRVCAEAKTLPTEDLIKMAHRVRGGGGNLGFAALFERMSDVENQALAEQEEEARRLAATAVEVVDAVRSALAELAPEAVELANEQQADAGPGEAGKAMAPWLERLADVLAQGDAEAAEQMSDETLEMEVPEVWQTRVGKLGMQLLDGDFEAALALVKELQSEL